MFTRRNARDRPSSSMPPPRYKPGHEICGTTEAELSNVVLVKKSSGKWHMCVHYAGLNKACPKYAYPLPNIDKLV
ncbi:hypothetical protein A2U01_0036626, partial [Trifolium medium]|nr:hypothetical protein [Trifolium medium]